MKKVFILCCILSAAVCFNFIGGQAAEKETRAEIYFVDRRLHRLVRTECEIRSAKSEKAAREIIDALIDGKDANGEILRLIPKNDGCVSVKLHKNTAIVNLSSDIEKTVPKNSENERLIVYQIVNSLTALDGIDTVRFTVDGENRRRFLGYLDMREIFTPDYDI